MQSKNFMQYLLVVLVSIGGGWLLNFLDGQGNWLIGWASASLLLLVGLGLLLFLWRWAGNEKALAWMMGLAFILRLGLGFWFEKSLPVLGNDNPEQKAGYVFYDSFRRDTQSWDLANSDMPLWMAYSEDITADQYGGFVSMSALVYRYLSPDAHRPWFILILGSVFAALGLPFLWKTANLLWGRGLAVAAGWIFALYPDSVFYGSSQMREPFLISLIAVIFCVLVIWQREGRRLWIPFILAGAGLVFFSWRVAIPAAVVCLGWLALGIEGHQLSTRQKALAWVIFILAGLGMAFVMWGWFNSATMWDTLLTQRQSGWVQFLLRQMDENFTLPFITLFGVAQVVLPAAILEPSNELWRIVATTRASGWYILAPLLVYASFAVFRVTDRRDKRLLLWLVATSWLWILISSARAGGDQWDNPRYRALFIVWQALVAGWAIIWAIKRKDPWLLRWLIVEGIFLAFFTDWYYIRYYSPGHKDPFWTMVSWILGLSGLVLLGGWLWDFWQRKRKRRS